MIINICNNSFESKNVMDIVITESHCLIDSKEGFIRMPYSSEEDIREARE